MYRILICILLITTSKFAFAQTGNLKGRIKLNQKEIEFATLFLLELEKGARTDEHGYFEFDNLPVGSHTLRVSYVGIKTIDTTIWIEENKTVIIEVQVERQGIVLEAIEIIDKLSGLDVRTPYTVSRVELNNLALKGNPSGIMGFLVTEPGIYGADLGQGIVKPFIRGLGFSRIVTLYQSNKLENHQWGADHGIGLNDLGVSSIDVIKGPASVLYGSGALGGVIIVNDDERYLKKQDLTLRSGVSFNSASLGYRPYLSIGKSFENGLFIATDSSIENHADYLDGNNRIIGNSRFASQTGRIHAGFKSEKFKSKLSYTFHQQTLGIIEETEMLPNESLATWHNDRSTLLPFQSVNDQIISYNQSSKGKIFNTSFNISHHINNRNEIEEDIESIDLGLTQHHTFLNARISSLPGKLIEHTFGIQASRIKTSNKQEATEILMPDARTMEGGIYYMASAKIKQTFVQAAIRYDNRSIIADANAPNIIDAGFELPGNPTSRKLRRNFSGTTASLGTNTKLNQNQNLKVNISTGFRAPDLAELFSNGNHPGTNRFEMGDVNFRREQSLQADLGWIYQRKSFSIEPAIFASRVNNFITFAGTGNNTTNGWEIWEFTQSDATLFGGEITARFEPILAQRIVFLLTGSMVRGIEIYSKNNLTFIPPDNIRFKIQWQPFSKYKTSLTSESRMVFTQNRPGTNEISTNGYTLFNLGIQHSWALKNLDKIHLSLNANNILNQHYIDHMSILRAFNIPAPGRNVMINIQYLF